MWKLLPSSMSAGYSREPARCPSINFTESMGWGFAASRGLSSSDMSISATAARALPRLPDSTIHFDAGGVWTDEREDGAEPGSQSVQNLRMRSLGLRR